jgi:hypothetical protein
MARCWEVAGVSQCLYGFHSDIGVADVKEYQVVKYLDTVKE